ncbi:hypothetical protein PHJA_000570400 [Phtheirospermum japonicum]|uniref:Uncharacterized protein n=1 Tax=Phtheirospermum japonicum TaxID=374723 RepID=A0A830BB56_9LAMI|nr:hypothetical protein PHJA_000570400 [Phtheirospermum japonicum]
MSLQSYPDMQMDVRDMSFFPDDSFDSVIDKGAQNQARELSPSSILVTELARAFFFWLARA